VKLRICGALSWVVRACPLAQHPKRSKQGLEFWKPLCYAQIGGLGIATFITLLLVPALYRIAVLDLKIIRRWELRQETPDSHYLEQEN